MKIVRSREEVKLAESETGIFTAGLTSQFCCPNVARANPAFYVLERATRKTEKGEWVCYRDCVASTAENSS